MVDHCEIVDRVLGQEIERRKNVGPVSLAKGNVVKEEFVRLTIFAGERAASLWANSLAAGAEFLGGDSAVDIARTLVSWAKKVKNLEIIIIYKNIKKQENGKKYNI